MKSRLSKWEKDIARDYEKGGWRSLGKGVKKQYTALARKQLKQERVNIRLSSETLGNLQSSALQEGIPYQTLISSVLYRYAHGNLQDERYLLEAARILKKAG